MSAAYRLALAQVTRRNPDASDEDLADWADELLADWEAEDARERAEAGIEDSPCIETCDDAGTGEGRFHGRM